MTKTKRICLVKHKITKMFTKEAGEEKEVEKCLIKKSNEKNSVTNRIFQMVKINC